LLRDQFMELAKKHGYKPGKKPPKTVKDKMRQELEAYFDTPEGQQVLKEAPRIWLPDAANSEGRMAAMTRKIAVEALLEELI